jgi:hypothetical protein
MTALLTNGYLTILEGADLLGPRGRGSVLIQSSSRSKGSFR